MRFVFLDEGGISQHEPFAIVAGVFVHGDTQLLPLEERLLDLKEKHILTKHHEGFCFHAKDIWSGKGIFKDKTDYPLFKRLNILNDLARVPAKTGASVVYYALRKDEFEGKLKGQSPRERIVNLHSLAFASCIITIEAVMRTYHKNEVAQVVAEDNSDARGTMKSIHQILKENRAEDGILFDDNILPLKTIANSTYFAEKKESPALQVADICAFIMRGWYCDHPHIGPLYRRLRRNLIAPPIKTFIGPEVRVNRAYNLVSSAVR